MKEDRQRTKGKKGIRTKATIKNHTWDSRFTKGDYVIYGKDPVCSQNVGLCQLIARQVVYSLNKHGRWEEVEILKKQVLTMPPKVRVTYSQLLLV